MTAQLTNTFIYAVLSGTATIVGVLLVFYREAWATRNSMYLVSFSAGVIISIAFIHILPEATELTDDALTAALLTIISFYILEYAIVIHHCREGECEVHPMGTLAFTGMTFHSLLDGLIIGVGFVASFEVGLVASLGVLLHRLPVGIMITSLLLHAHYTSSKAMALGCLVAVAAPIGAIGSYFLFSSVEESFLGVLLGISAGSFIYIGASDLLPETHKNLEKRNILLVLLGLFLVYMMAHFLGH